MSIQLELTVTAGKPIYRGHDHYWSVIRDLGKNDSHFTVREVALRSNDRDDYSISDFVKRLAKADYIEVVDTEKVPIDRGGYCTQYVYRLLKRPSATPIINRDGSHGTQGLRNQQMWNAMRLLPQFDKHELGVAATIPETEVSSVTAGSYAKRLAAAGYLQILRPGGANLTRIWRLKPSMNTGPRAPKILATKVVWDQNRSEIVGGAVAEECAA